MDSKLKNRRCIAMVRCSTDKQSRRSLPQQIQWLKDHCEEKGMTFVDHIREAVSASQITRRPDIEAVIRRKQEGEDFDTVLVQDLSRLTRGGTEHGIELYFEFKKLGLKIVSVLDGLIEGDEALQKAVKRFSEARATAEATALVAARGAEDEIKSGRCTYSRYVPYGLDRMITDQDGNPLCILRNLPDGTQQQLDPHTRQVQRVYAKNADGMFRHYRKQGDEKSTFVAGEEKRIKIVNQIFRRRFIDGWSSGKIARELNDQGHAAPKGGIWYSNSVMVIYANSIYIGVGYANRYSTSHYFSRGKTCPISVTDLRKATGQNTGTIYRPEAQWEEFEFPELENYLSFITPELREGIMSAQLKLKRKLVARVPSKRGGDKHDDSPFILKNICHSKQGDHPMSGKASWRHGRYYRYYCVSRAFNAPQSNSKLRPLIRADALEDAALNALKEVLTDYDGIKAAVAREMNNSDGQYSDKPVSMESLSTKRDKILKQMEYWVERLGDIDQKLIDTKMASLKLKLNELTAALEALERAKRRCPLAPALMQTNLANQCKEVLAQIDLLPRAALRRILRIIIKRMTVDLETYEVEIELHMPVWAIRNGIFSTVGVVCLESTTGTNLSNEANPQKAVKIGHVNCTRKIVKRNSCFTCRRKAA